MHRLRIAHLFVFGLSIAVTSCGKKEEAKPQVQAAAVPEQPAPAPVAVSEAPAKPAVPVTPVLADDAPASQSLMSHLGEFGSAEPLERTDLPQRGILFFPADNKGDIFMPAEHWEQYNFPFKAKRSGRYQVRLSYTLKSSTMGVQLKLGENRIKKQLKHSNAIATHTYLGEVTIAEPGDQFMALYTPNGVGWNSFILHGIDLVPAADEVVAAEDGTVHLLARDAATWSENMRYEPKAEKNCLGYWTEKEDFAEWEFKVEKPGIYQVTVHQGCGAGGGSEVAVEVGDQQLEFKVQDTGGFQNWTAIPVGELRLEKAGTYRLAVKPQTKNGTAIMDVQKIVLSPVS